MEAKEQFGYVRCNNIIFRDYAQYVNFISKLLKDFKSYVVKIDGKRVVGEGPFKLLTPEQMESLEKLRIEIKTDEKQNMISITGYGYRSYVWGIEEMIKVLYDANVIVTYDTSNVVLNTEGEGPTQSEIDTYNDTWLKEQDKRKKMLKEGTFPPVIIEEEAKAHSFKI